jgi:hypothetical protein
MSDTAPTSAPAAAPASAPATPPSAPAPQGGNPANDTQPSTANGYKAFVDQSNQRRQERIAADKLAKQQQQQTSNAPPPGPQNPSPPPPKPPEQTPEGEPPAAAEQAPQWTEQDIADLKKYREWMAGETIPEELLAKLVALKDGDNVDYEPFEEMKKERMMQRDYSREMGKIKVEREQMAQRLAPYEQHFAQTMGEDPVSSADALFEVYTRHGKYEHLMKLGEKLAQIEQEDIDTARGYAMALAYRNGYVDQQGRINWNDHRVASAYESKKANLQNERVEGHKRRAVEFENQRLREAQQQRQQQGQVEEDAARLRKQLDQLRPRAFEAKGLDHENPRHMVAFNEQLHAILSLEGVKITPEVVMRAAKAAKQELDAREKGGANNPPPKPQPKPFVSRSGGGAAPIANQKGGAAPEWHIGNFQQKHGRR